MTRLLIGYDGSEPARAAIALARALFGPVEATVAHVHPPPPTTAAAGLARVALPDTMIAEGLANLRTQAETEARELTAEGVAHAQRAGLRTQASVRYAITPWRELQKVAAEDDVDVIVCGTAGEGPIERAVLGSTASSLLHHADRPLLVVPGGAEPADGPVFAGFDGSAGARAALRFAAARLRTPLVVVHAVDSRSGTESAAATEGAALASSLGLEARALSLAAGRSAWRTVLAGAQAQGALAILVGSRGRGAVTSTVLGSVASGLVHAAALPVLIVPEEAP